MAAAALVPAAPPIPFDSVWYVFKLHWPAYAKRSHFYFLLGAVKRSFVENWVRRDYSIAHQDSVQLRQVAQVIPAPAPRMDVQGVHVPTNTQQERIQHHAYEQVTHTIAQAQFATPSRTVPGPSEVYPLFYICPPSPRLLVFDVSDYN